MQCTKYCNNDQEGKNLILVDYGRKGTDEDSSILKTISTNFPNCFIDAAILVKASSDTLNTWSCPTVRLSASLPIPVSLIVVAQHRS